MKDEKERDAREKMAEHLEQLQQEACYLVDLFPNGCRRTEVKLFGQQNGFFFVERKNGHCSEVFCES